jgi:hypothetical protein
MGGDARPTRLARRRGADRKDLLLKDLLLPRFHITYRDHVLASRGVCRSLFGLRSWNPVTLACSIASLALIAVVAGVVPFLRHALVFKYPI